LLSTKANEAGATENTGVENAGV